MTNLKNSTLYVNRELSQIQFNKRVLAESMNRDHPLLERAKFLAIFSSNMDEFFMVRVSGLQQQLLLGITKTPPDGLTPREQLSMINRVVLKLVAEQMEYWREIETELVKEGIAIRPYADLKSGRRKKLRDYFREAIFPALTPLAFDVNSHPFPHISNLSLNLAVVVHDPQKQTRHLARVKVPSALPRLVPLRPIDANDIHQKSGQKFVWLEEVIIANLDMLFPGMEIIEAHPFRVTRNNDMEIDEEEAENLVLTMEESLRQRHFGRPVRLEVSEKMPSDVRKRLMQNLEVKSPDLYTVEGPLALSALWELQKVERSELKDPKLSPRRSPQLRTGQSVFTILKAQDLIVHRPYESFKDVVAFLNEAAEDEDVVAIKMTLYRVGRNPAVVDALMQARENGKQVAVLVEIKARFDEESNITWARQLEKAGVHVIYGLVGLKTHAKIALVVRRENNQLRSYLHLSTGNYNATTARVYEDIDLLTSNPKFAADATELFNVLTGFSHQTEYRQFLVAPQTLRPKLLTLIENEMALGKNGRIMIKCNSLADARMIRALYRASQAGVQVDLIVRGICCLRPGIEGVSDNIRVKSIVGRFLEHSRVFCFRNEGKNEGEWIVYAGSADLMTRNLDRRIEVVFPIEAAELKQQLITGFLEPQLNDTAQGHWMQSNGTYIKALAADGEKPFSSQLSMVKR